MAIQSKSSHRRKRNKRSGENAYTGSPMKMSHVEIPRLPRQPTKEVSSRTVLKEAEPPIQLDQLDHCSPQPITIQHLEKRFNESMQAPCVPRGLEKFMQGCDFDDGNICGFEDRDFDDSINLNEFQLNYIWKNVNRVVNNTMKATLNKQDKDFWIRNVFEPLLHVVFAMYNKYNWSLTPLTDIMPLNNDYGTHLLQESQRDISDSSGGFTLGYCPKTPSLNSGFSNLEAAGLGPFSDDDTYKVLFSGFEVATKASEMNDAELQLSLWAAASLRRKSHLLDLVRGSTDLPALVEPMIIMVGARHHFYYCYSSSDEELETRRTYVLQSQFLEDMNTWTVRGVFRLAKFYGAIMQYGVDQSTSGFRGQFIDKLVESMAGLQ